MKRFAFDVDKCTKDFYKLQDKYESVKMLKTGHNDQCDATINMAIEMSAFNMGGPLLFGGLQSHKARYL